MTDIFISHAFTLNIASFCLYLPISTMQLRASHSTNIQVAAFDSKFEDTTSQATSIVNFMTYFCCKTMMLKHYHMYLPRAYSFHVFFLTFFL